MQTDRLDEGLLRTAAPNGLVVLSERLPGLRSAATGIWVRSASAHEPREKMAPFDFGDSYADKSDSEVAFADAQIGRLRTVVERFAGESGVAYVIVADLLYRVLDRRGVICPGPA